MPLIPDKEVKKRFKKTASEQPDKYYATTVLKAEGFARGVCKKCGTAFWSAQAGRETCDDPSCSGGFRFFEDNPAREPLDYVQVWKRFSALFRKLGYTPINRYPVIARWRDDTDFVQASIYDFQPYVVSGEIDPPANPLVVPQFSLRFNDIDNVGITMSHMTGFIMIGQHAFMPKERWDQAKVFRDIYTWLTQGLGLPKEEIIFHEDAWAGGGNFGPCMEFFSRGCELGNQVYMLYEQSEGGDKELPLKVLDMGMGQDRVAWFTQGRGTIYDAAFPTVMERLYERTGVRPDEQLVRKYLPYASYLNADEIEDIAATWGRVGKEIGEEPAKLKERILPLAALYSVAEHARTLLVALSDGGLPSNVGGGYNLRVILRRALGFIDDYGWNVSLGEVCHWHADYLKELYPEVARNLDDVEKILVFEKQRYDEAKRRNEHVVERLVAKEGSVSTEKLVELYDSQGIAPEELAKAARKAGKSVVVPDNFYALVAERHSTNRTASTATVKGEELPLEGLPATEALYFDHYDYVAFEAHVLKVIGRRVVLDRSAFYPTSGGQINDVGTLGGVEVVDVFKQATPAGTVIVHVLSKEVPFKAGEKVPGRIDLERRTQLAQHHTATHILTGSCRRVLGDHVWQAGAAKTVEKSRLDITHYEQLSEQDVAAIEEVANGVVEENLPVVKSFMARDVAEKRYGMRLYQGGAVPGKRLRIVSVEGFDVEACGGTHLDVTGDVGHIKILRTSKIQDGVVRLEFVAGAAADRALGVKKGVVREALGLLGGTERQLPGRVAELFELWKRAKKGKLEAFVLSSKVEYEGDVVAAMASALKTQPEHVVKTIRRFRADIEKKLKKK